MIQLKEINGKMYASAIAIHEYLEVKTWFSQWIPKAIKNAGLTKDIDFLSYKLESTGGRPIIDYLLTERSAIRIILQSRMPKSVELETLIVDAFKEKQTGILLNADQVAALTDMVKAMTLVSVQKKAENKHYIAMNKPDDWWKYRAELLGYSKESLIEALNQINVRYQNQKQALIHLDKAEIIRTGVVDLLIALGRNREYALNVAEFAKIIAEKNGYHLQIWDDTKPNPLGLRLPEIIERQKLNPLAK